jgi:hypothetical protein
MEIQELRSARQRASLQTGCRPVRGGSAQILEAAIQDCRFVHGDTQQVVCSVPCLPPVQFGARKPRPRWIFLFVPHQRNRVARGIPGYAKPSSKCSAMAKLLNTQGFMAKRSITTADFIALQPGRGYPATVGLAGPGSTLARELKGPVFYTVPGMESVLTGQEVVSLFSNEVTVEK